MAASGELVAEATALGADGVIGILTFTETSTSAKATVSSSRLGTAIRISSATGLLSRPFTTTLPGQDVAKLLHSGYAPTAAIIAVSVGIRHERLGRRGTRPSCRRQHRGPRLLRARPRRSEPTSQCELMPPCRAAAGANTRRRSSPRRSPLGIHEIRSRRLHRDHVGQASLVATGIVEFETLRPADPAAADGACRSSTRPPGRPAPQRSALCEPDLDATTPRHAIRPTRSR